MKYELTNETKMWSGIELHRIKALEDFGNVKKDDLGGWIEKEKYDELLNELKKEFGGYNNDKVI